MEDPEVIDYMRRCGYLPRHVQDDNVPRDILRYFRDFAQLVDRKAREGFWDWLTKHGSRVQLELFEKEMKE